MKLHLPIVLLTAVLGSLCVTQSALAVAPSSNPINLDSAQNTELTGGTQTGAITGAGNLVISSGTVNINHSSGENAYTGNTIINSGATLTMKNWSGASSSIYKQFGTGSLIISGTLDFDTGAKDPATRTLNNNITLNDGATLRAGDHGITFGGALSLASGTAHMRMDWGNEWVFSGSKTGAGTISFERASSEEVQLFVLRGDNDTFTGTYKLDAGGSKSTIVLENTNSAKNAHIQLTTASSYLTLKNIDATIAGLTGNGRIQNGVQNRGHNGSFTAGATAKTLTVNQTNTATDVFSGVIDNNVNITKAGVGTLQLTNLNGYTGLLRAQSGTLDANFVNSSYDLRKAQVDAGATLKLSNGSFAISSENISLGSGTVEFAGTNNFLFNSFVNADGATTIGKLTFNGTLAGTNLVTINKKINSGDSFLLFTTDSESNASASAGTLRSSNVFYKAAFSAQGNNIILDILGYGDDVLEWTGGSGEWATNGTTWKDNAGNPATFSPGKKAVFSDIADTAEAAITISGDIASSGVLFNSDATNYSLSGTGKITGAGTLVKDGLNTVTIQTANDYTGLTDVQKGTLTLSGNGQIAGDTKVASGASLGVERGGSMSDILKGSLTILEGGNLILTPGNGNTFTFNKALASGSKAIVEINSGTVNFGLGNINGISKFIVNQGAFLNTTSGMEGADGIITEIKGGTVNIGSAGNSYTLAGKGAEMIFSDHQGSIINASGQWRWEGDNSPFKITVKEEASGSTLSGGTICFTRGTESLGSGIIDVQGKDTLFTISSAFAEQGGGGPEGISKKGAGTLVLSGSNNTSATHLTIHNGTVQIKDSSSWKSHIYVNKTASEAGKLIVNNNWAVNSGRTFANNSEVLIQGAGSGLNISAATVSGNGNYTIDTGSLNIGNKAIAGNATLVNGGNLIANGGSVNSLFVNSGSTVTGALTVTSLQFNLVENFTGTYLTSTAAITFTGDKITLNLAGMTGSYTGDSDYTFNLASAGNLQLDVSKFESSYTANNNTWDFKNYDSATGNLTLTFKGNASIPEPSSVSLGLIGLTALLMRRRRK